MIRYIVLEGLYELGDPTPSYTVTAKALKPILRVEV